MKKLGGIEGVLLWLRVFFKTNTFLRITPRLTTKAESSTCRDNIDRLDTVE